MRIFDRVLNTLTNHETTSTPWRIRERNSEVKEVLSEKLEDEAIERLRLARETGNEELLEEAEGLIIEARRLRRGEVSLLAALGIHRD